MSGLLGPHSGVAPPPGGPSIPGGPPIPPGGPPSHPGLPGYPPGEKNTYIWEIKPVIKRDPLVVGGLRTPELHTRCCWVLCVTIY